MVHFTTLAGEPTIVCLGEGVVEGRAWAQDQHYHPQIQYTQLAVLPIVTILVELTRHSLASK